MKTLKQILLPLAFFAALLTLFLGLRPEIIKPEPVFATGQGQLCIDEVGPDTYTEIDCAEFQSRAGPGQNPDGCYIGHHVAVGPLPPPNYTEVGCDEAAQLLASEDNPKAPDSATLVDGKCPDGYTHVGVPLQGSDPCIKDSTGDNNPIYVYMRLIIQFLAAGTGLVIVLMIIVGGIQYIVSQGDPQGTAAAKGRILNAIIALFLFIFMSAILNFLIPGGIL